MFPRFMILSISIYLINKNLIQSFTRCQGNSSVLHLPIHIQRYIHDTNQKLIFVYAKSFIELIQLIFYEKITSYIDFIDNL